MTSTKVLDGNLFRQLLLSGASNLERNRETVNNLNVFPVPDGDTGTNMSLTMSNLPALEPQSAIGKYAADAARSMMRAARGNSGVILSLFFRGVARVMDAKETADVADLLRAVREGAKSAAAAVDKPVEGTILTVMRECSTGIDEGDPELTVQSLFDRLYGQAEAVLQKTPEMLPALRRAHVVDSGGYGFVRVLEGICAALHGKEIAPAESAAIQTAPAANFEEFNSEEIRFAFCTECLLDIEEELPEKVLSDLRRTLSSMGDSMVLTADDEILKVHVHTNEPLKVLSMLYELGTPRTSKIENMRLQHDGIAVKTVKQEKPKTPRKKYGVFAVSPGDGFTDLFKELGSDSVIGGGQSMNPSADSILRAIEETPCETAIILPNNSNIILTAKQVAEMAVGTRVIVIPTKTLPQGVSALFAYNESRTPEENEAEMTSAASAVSTLSFTHAVRDAELDGLTVRSGQYLGLCEGKVVAAHDALREVAAAMLSYIPEDAEILTLYYGQGVKEETAEDMARLISDGLGGIDISVTYGGQPLYPFMISAE